MRFSRKTDYGLIFLKILKNSYKSGRAVSVAWASHNFGLPRPYLEKVALKLKSAGIVKSQKGRRGGYYLSKNPKDITLQEILDIFEESKMVRCLDVPQIREKCQHENNCPAQKGWGDIESQITKIFEKATLANL